MSPNLEFIRVVIRSLLSQLLQEKEQTKGNVSESQND